MHSKEIKHMHTVNGGYVDPIKQLGLPKIISWSSDVVQELL